MAEVNMRPPETHIGPIIFDHIRQISYKYLYSAAFCRLSFLPLNTDIGGKRQILNKY